MMTQPTTMPPQSSPSESPMPPAKVRPARFGLIFGVVATVLTLGAIALAVFAPQLTSSPTLQVPQGWQQVYNDNPGNSSSSWDNAGGCAYTPQGLNISSDSTCEFKLANHATRTDGVLVVARLAPAADVSLSQDAGIVLDGADVILIDQQGNYTICIDSCDAFSSGKVLATGSTVAWHTDAFVSNEIAALYGPNQDSVDFYVNGQFVAHIDSGLSASPSIALTTSSSGEALFTHVAIYAGSLGLGA